VATAITRLSQLVGHNALVDADADILTAGSASDADSLHTHPGKAAASHTHARTDLTAETSVRYQTSLMCCRNANGSVITPSGGTGNFAIWNDGWGGGYLCLVGNQAKGATKTDTMSFEFPLPPEYVAGDDVKLVAAAAFSVGGTPGTCTIDAEVYEVADDTTTGSDLCQTAAQNLTTSVADYTFVVNASNLAPGDRLLVFVRTSVQETGNAVGINAYLGAVEMQLDIKG
jgi:hypothetical protein